MRPRLPRAALGLRAHSGWAALVAVAGTRERPVVVARERIELADPSIAGSMQPYHAAEELALPKAAAFLRRCERGSKSLARRAFRSVLGSLEKKGYRAAGCGLLLASGRPLPDLQGILASHAVIHTADGEHFRDALIHACEDGGLAVTRVREKELLARAQAFFGVPGDELQRRVAALGREIGPPWTQDQKLAALLGWLVLANGPGG